MVTLETEESGRCREVLNQSQCMDFLSTGTKKVAVVERWPLTCKRWLLADFTVVFQEIKNGD